MTQQSGSANWVIHDSGGHPQMFKLVQSAGKSISGIMTSAMAGGQPVKIFKTVATSQEQQGGQVVKSFGTVSSQPQVIRTIGGTTPTKLVAKTVTLPVSTMAALQSAKGTKTIRLTPTTMQNIKLINTQKIQINNPGSATSAPATIPIFQQQLSQQQQQQQHHQTQHHVPQTKYVAPPILDHSGSRKRQEPMDTEFTPDSKRSRKTEKVGKGLRHFSMKVCEKVREKGTTSYNEVADELVNEFTHSPVNSSLVDQYDQKNIRRRVYDALNVLMAMNIISKEKKEIRWIGLPTNSLQECIQLQKEKQKRIESIRKKTKDLQCLIMNQISFKNLAQRNLENEKIQGPPPPNSYIQLPFIVVNTNKKTVIDCSISNDKMEYLFQFNDKFEINDDQEVLKSIGMLMGLDRGEVSPEDLEKIKLLVPRAFEEFVVQLANGTGDHIEQVLESAGPGPSSMSMFTAEDVVETQIDEENSHQSSSFDPLSPGAADFTDDEPDSDDMSSDVELN